MIQRIVAHVAVETKDEADALDARLSEAGADTFVSLRYGRWSVSAEFEQNDAAHVGRALLGFSA